MATNNKQPLLVVKEENIQRKDSISFPSFDNPKMSNVMSLSNKKNGDSSRNNKDYLQTIQE